MTDGHNAQPHFSGDGDGWVTAADGEKRWGLYGAAGLLLYQPGRGVLLQHRVSWSHHGGTWGIPGGARHSDERPSAAAIRECREETGVPGRGDIDLLGMAVLDLEPWSYSTLFARARTRLEAEVTDVESVDVAWVDPDAVVDLPLHPGFHASWPTLRHALDRNVTMVVDAANTVGSKPNGWWRDRAGATRRFVAGLARALRADAVTLPAETLGLPGDYWWPQRTIAVVEGKARGNWMSETDDTVELISATGEGDDTIAEVAGQLARSGNDVVTVTADRELQRRVAAVGGSVVGPGTLWLPIESDGSR